MGLEDTEIDYNDMDTLKSCDLSKKYNHKLPNTILNNKSPSTVDPHQKQACVSPWKEIRIFHWAGFSKGNDRYPLGVHWLLAMIQNYGTKVARDG